MSIVLVGLIARSITALTAVARQTKTIGAGTASAHVEPMDFASIACRVLTTVAANLGGVEELLKGCPGSREAGLVRRVVEATAPKDELPRWRSEPVRLVLDVEAIFDDFGLLEMFDFDQETAGYRADMIKLYVDPDGVWWTATKEERARFDAETGRAPGSWTTGDLADATEIVKAIRDLIARDQDTYAAAFADTVRHIAADRGVGVGVKVTRVRPGKPTKPAPRDAFAAELYEIAWVRTPLPMTGEPPDFSDGLPADAVRRAGKSYLTALRAIQANPTDRP